MKFLYQCITPHFQNVFYTHHQVHSFVLEQVLQKALLYALHRVHFVF